MEREFIKLPGENLVCAVDPQLPISEVIELRFCYAHAGFITNSKNGQGAVYIFVLGFRFNPEDHEKYYG